jgi:uncharacterized Zn-binding protein involved in type VI secretion
LIQSRDKFKEENMGHRPFIVVGDQTDHGGVVVGGSAMTDTHGKRIARVGDEVTCPKKGHGTTVIISGDQTMIIDGRAAARQGDKCACGAILLASQAVSTTSDGGTANPQAASDAQKAKAASAGVFTHYASAVDDNDAGHSHDIHFLVTDEATGNPLVKTSYRLTLEDGTSVTGRTDGQGLTKKISSNTQQIARIEAPYYDHSTSTSDTHIGHDACDC